MNNLCVVTGGFGALGTAVVDTLGARGFRVATIDLASAPSDARGALAIGDVDLAEPEAAEQAFGRLDREGPIAGLVNVAGGFAWEQVAQSSLHTWDSMYRINLRTAVCACRAAIPRMSAGSAIVNIGAMGAVAPAEGMAAYAAAKSGVARLTESLADELKSRGIRVNALLPSIIDTPANRRDMPNADPSGWVSAADLAGIIAFLLSDAARPITGACIPVRG